MLAVVPGIVRISRLGGAFNCYLVQESDGMTLVDTMFPFVAQEILDTATALHAPIRRILLTHAHGDHVGALDKLAAKLPGIEVAIGRRESRFMARDFSLDASEPQTKVRGMFPKVVTRPAVLLDEGALYGSLRVIATPGHTPGHLSFLHLPSGVLLAGDALATIPELRVVTDGPWYFPFGKFATWHAPTALASTQKLAALNLQGVAPGHGKPVLGKLSAAFEHSLRRVDK